MDNGAQQLSGTNTRTSTPGSASMSSGDGGIKMGLVDIPGSNLWWSRSPKGAERPSHFLATFLARGTIAGLG